MAKTEEQVYVKYKYALALKKLQEKNKIQKKKNDRKGIVDNSFDHSYGAISSSTGLRAATISNIITGSAEIKTFTLYLILSSLNVSYSQFGKVFDKLTETEVINYKNQITKERHEREEKSRKKLKNR